MKAVFYNIIVHLKYGFQGEETTLDFKYVPEYSTITEMGESEEEMATFSHVESRNRKSFVIGLTVLGFGTWVAFRFWQWRGQIYLVATAFINKSVHWSEQSRFLQGSGVK